MIFHPDHAHAIRDGNKTQHRLPVQRGQWLCPHQPGQIRKVQPARQRTDKDPSRPPRHICRITILHVTRDVLGNITDPQAQAEGYADYVQFMDDWQHRHGLDDWPVDQPVWVITFELYKRTAATRPAAPVWLHKGVIGNGDPDCEYADLAEHGYTTDPAGGLIDAGEVLDAARSSGTFESAKRWRDEKQAQARQQADMPLTERLERALADARSEGVDTRRYEQAINARVRAIENRLGNRRNQAA